MTEDQVYEKDAKHCDHCKRNCLLPYEYEWTCISCVYNVIERKHQLTYLKFKEKINFINRLKNAEHKILSICTDVYILYKGKDYDKIYEALSTFKNENLKKKQFNRKI